MITKCDRTCYVSSSEGLTAESSSTYECHVRDSGIQDVDHGHAPEVAYRVHGDDRVHIDGNVTVDWHQSQSTQTLIFHAESQIRLQLFQATEGSFCCAAGDGQRQKQAQQGF